MYQPTFIELYQEAKGKPSPGEAFLQEVADLTHRSKSTVRKWVLGISVPDFNTQVEISRHFNIPVETLFPPKNKKRHE